jgi:Ca-activated chloride channel family protein
MFRRTAFILILGSWFLHLPGQQTQIYKPNVNRILFILDGSGSMKQKWGDVSKFELAKELLSKLIDSVERKNPNVEFAVRIFGYQFNNTERNCKDSKLVIPFAKNNASKINAALGQIVPKGMSPITFSISQGAQDFPDDVHALNSIILITDGEETCGGDPCKTTDDLLAKRIVLKPFIVGLNVDSSSYSKFACMGTFFDTKDKASLFNAVGVIIKQTINTTTAQINLLDQHGNPTITNIPFTLYDHYTGKIEYNFVHTMNERGNPDTLFLDPVGIYDLELHTFPSIRQENITLAPGKHNIIALDVPYTDLNIECVGASIATNDAQIVIRKKDDLKNILNVQDFNGAVKYLASNYQLEILTAPQMVKDTPLPAFSDTKIKVPGYGTLSLIVTGNMLASIYSYKNGLMQLVERFESTVKSDNHHLQPGEYRIVYKPKNDYHSSSTKTKGFMIEDGKTAVLTL